MDRGTRPIVARMVGPATVCVKTVLWSTLSTGTPAARLDSTPMSLVQRRRPCLRDRPSHPAQPNTCLTRCDYHRYRSGGPRVSSHDASRSDTRLAACSLVRQRRRSTWLTMTCSILQRLAGAPMVREHRPSDRALHPIRVSDPVRTLPALGPRTSCDWPHPPDGQCPSRNLRPSDTPPRAPVLLGDRDGDRCLVDVQTDEPGTLRPGPASRMWLCAGKLRLPAQSAMLRERRSFHVD